MSDKATESTLETIPEIITRLVAVMGFADPAEINDEGYSWVFSDKLAAALDDLDQPATILDSDQIKRNLPAHEWVVYGGRHYDSETPDGVDDPLDLPFLQRHGLPKTQPA